MSESTENTEKFVDKEAKEETKPTKEKSRYTSDVDAKSATVNMTTLSTLGRRNNVFDNVVFDEEVNATGTILGRASAGLKPGGSLFASRDMSKKFGHLIIVYFDKASNYDDGFTRYESKKT